MLQGLKRKIQEQNNTSQNLRRCSKAVVPVLVLLFVALWFIIRGDLFYVLPCVILFLCFSVLLALRLTRLTKRADLSAFRTFVRFVLVWICRIPLPRCMGRDAVCDCGTPWTFLLFFKKKKTNPF